MWMSLVVGGGPGGVAAAVNAARLGVTTLVCERYGRLGGGAVTNLVQPFLGVTSSPFTAEVMRRFVAKGQDTELLDLLYADMLHEAGAGILLHVWANGVEMDGNRVTGVHFVSKQGPLTIGAKVIIDATGDGDVAFLAGAACEQGRPGDGLLQPMSIMYRLGGVDKTRALLCGSEEQAMKVTVPEGIWHDVVHAGHASGELPENIGVIRVYEYNKPGERVVNATQINYVDGTNVEDLTKAELECRRQAVAVLNFLKKHAPGYENAYVSHMPAAIGVRETRRFLGVEYLQRDDLTSGRTWDSAVVRDVVFVVDIHNPTGGGQAEGFAAKVKPYDIPYGSLVPRDTDGLLIASRCISGSHEAHASYRVQKIVLGIGAAAGAAAALAVRHSIQPCAVSPGEIRQSLGVE